MARQYLILPTDTGWITRCDSIQHGAYATRDEAVHQALALAWNESTVGGEAEIVFENEDGEISGRWTLLTPKRTNSTD